MLAAIATNAASGEPMRSGNPVLGQSTFLDAGAGTVVRHDAGAMSLNGTVNKTAFLLVVVLATSMYTWSRAFAGAELAPYVWGGALGGLALALATVFRKTWAPVTAPLYAAVEGLFIGAISAVFEQRYPGICCRRLGSPSARSPRC